MNTGLLTGRENEAIEGIYPLGKLLADTSDSAIYETTYGDAGEPALIQLRRGDTPEGEQHLHRWREALELSHPNLIRLYAAGASVLDGVPVIYLIMERTDESLAGVLAERALSQEETREMLEPALSALSYLHKNGYTHAALDPSNIHAVGETLKLSSEGVRRMGDGAAAADDMSALGVVLVQALTRDVPQAGNDSEPYILRDVPEPFSGIAAHCLEADPQKRWTAEQALGHLHTGAAPSLPARFQEQIFPSVDRNADRSPDQSNARPARAAYEAPESPGTDYRKWLYAGIAGLVVIAAFAGLKRRTDTGPAAVPNVQTANAPAPAAQVRSPEVPQPAVAPSPPVSPPVNEKRTVAKPADRRADGWAVVIAAYGARGPAQKRAREMARKWPKFKVDVFEPPSEKARHLVVLGTNLSEADAEALRQRAVTAGLARDTYIKRFAPRHR